MDPIGLCFAESLQGIKHSQDLKNATYLGGFLQKKIPKIVLSLEGTLQSRAQWGPF